MNSENPYKVLLYYKYQKIVNPQEFVQQQKIFCEKHNISGRIIIAKEGINGTCAGSPESTKAYMDYMHSLPGFENLWFKVQNIEHIPFKKLQIRERKEIVTSGIHNIYPETGSENLSPEEVNSMWEQGAKDGSVIFFDVRNEIESKLGRFKNAITTKIEFFRELPHVIDQYVHLKDKKIVLYCTGGIRCEKASVLFKKKKFKDVYQINGGIYNYCKQFPNKYFEGTCFVFDDRMQICFEKNKIEQIEKEKEISDDKIISHCDFCDAKTKRVVNDERNNGHHLVLCCEDCDKKLDVSRVRFKRKNMKKIMDNFE